MNKEDLYAIRRIYETQVEHGMKTIQLNRISFEELLNFAEESIEKEPCTHTNIQPIEIDYPEVLSGRCRECSAIIEFRDLTVMSKIESVDYGDTVEVTSVTFTNGSTIKTTPGDKKSPIRGVSESLGVQYYEYQLGEEESPYGGDRIIMSSLPVGTKFHVENGHWDGSIIEIDGEKHIYISDDSTINLTTYPDFDLSITIKGEKN